MRVLHILASSLGGGATHVFDLITHPHPQMEQRVVIPRDGGTIVNRLRQNGYTVKELEIDKGWKWREFFSLIRYIREYQPDIVHCHGMRAGLYGRLATKWVSRKIKIVLTVHGFHLFYHKSRMKKKLLFLLEKLLRRLTDHVIAVSKSDWHHLLECGLVSKEKSQVILNGIQVTVKSSLSKEKARSVLNISDNQQPIIMTICRLHHQKGMIHLIQAIPYVLQQVPNARFVIIGDGPQREHLEEAAKETNINRSIQFMGNRSDASDLLPAADIFVLPSLWEGLPLCLLEAMRAEVPIVATDVDGNREVVDHEKSGLLVPPKNPEALAHAITTLLHSPSLQKNLAREAKIRLYTVFPLETMLQKTRHVYTNELPQH